MAHVVVIDGVTYISPAEAPEYLGSDVSARMVYDWCRPGGRVIPLRAKGKRGVLVPLDDLRLAEKATRGRGRRRRGPAEVGSDTQTSEVA